MLPPSNKRRREDVLDEDRGGKERKKPRPLSLQTTFISSHDEHRPLHDHPAAFYPNPPTLTPAESSEDDDGMDRIESGVHTFPANDNNSWLDPMSMQSRSDADVDLEMVDSSQPGSADGFPPWSAGLTSTHSDVSMTSPIPSQFVNRTLSVSGGRTATPIYSHFTSNMNVDAMMKDNNVDPTLLSPHYPGNNAHAPNPQHQGQWRNRRLPSPVSEDEKPASPNLIHTPDPKDSARGGAQPLGHGCVRNSKLGAHVQTVEHDYLNEIQQAPADVESSTSSSAVPSAQARTSRTKTGIAMGYRADCDKCQRRVPGHYSHIVRL